MKKLERKTIYFANPASPHVARWLFFREATSLRAIFHIRHGRNTGTGTVPNSTTANLITSFPNLFGFFSYVIGGLIFRFSYRRSYGSHTIVHAHGSSGYGCMALLSGMPYCAGIYGTEVYDAKSRGRLYNFLLKQILKKALRIHTYSLEMKNKLTRDFGISPDKIRQFDLGIDESLYAFSQELRVHTRRELGIPDDSIVFCVNRRIHPYYDTETVIAKFIRFRSKYAGDSRLILLAGDSDRHYLDQIKALIRGHEGRITLYDEFLESERMRALLCASDFTISMPKTDEHSASVTQSLSCRAIPILRDNLQNYSILPEPCRIFSSLESLHPCFEDICRKKSEFWNEARKAGAEYAKKNHGNKSAESAVRSFYDDIFAEIA